MNIFRTNSASYFVFDETAAGTGGASSPPGGTASPSPAPAPSSAPAPVSPTPASPDGSTAPPSPSADAGAASSASSDPYAGMGMDFEDLDEIILPGQPPATAAGTAPTPAAPPAQPGQPQPPAAPAQAAPAPAPAATPSAPTGTTPTSPLDQLRIAAEGFKTNAPDLAKWAGNELFKLSDEEVTALTTDAAGAIPGIAGRVYAQSLHAAANLIQNLVPNLVTHMIEQQHGQRTRASEAMNQFWTENKDLDATKHGQLVQKWAKVFRQANPQATRAEAISFVARAVRNEAGLPMPGAQAPVPSAPQAPAAFAPARPGGRTPHPTAEHDPYSGLGMDFDE